MIGWDEEVPRVLREQHERWRAELPLLADIKLSRCYFAKEPTLTVQLHGFSDASEAAYSAVIYIRATYANSPPSCQLVISKPRVAPVKQFTIPRLELAGAKLLADILTTT